MTDGADHYDVPELQQTRTLPKRLETLRNHMLNWQFEESRRRDYALVTTSKVAFVRHNYTN